MSGLKTIDNTQFALASPDGTRAGTGFPGLVALAPGDGTEPIADLEGRLWVRQAPIGPPGFPTKVQASANALTNSQLIQAGPCKLSTLSGFNNTSPARYVQIYDLAIAPGVGNVPVQVFSVSNQSEFSWSSDQWQFVNGIWIALSTMPLSFTAASASMFWNAELYTP